LKKNLIITILALISIASLIFGYIQKQKAEEQEALATELSEAKRKLESQIELEQQTRKEISEKAQQELLKMRKEAELAQKNK
jgi:Flp pilus assembly protein TadB